MISETYVSIDIETDGPIPERYSMMSLGAVAFSTDGNELSAFSRNLSRLEGAGQHPATTLWWATQPRAYAIATSDQRPPREVMYDFNAWLLGLPGKPVAVAYPLMFDMMFVYWYQIRFVGYSPFGFSGIDIKTLAYGALGAKSFRNTTKKTMPKNWFGKEKHTHVAVEDAREQAHLFFEILNVIRQSREG